MKQLYKYYVCDSLTESIIGSFYALNDKVAEKVVEETINSNEKVKMVGESLVVRRSPTFVCEYETYNEVVEYCNIDFWTPMKANSKGIINE